MTSAGQGGSQRRPERSLRNLLGTARVGVGIVHEANVRLFWTTMVGEAAGAVLLGLQVYLGKLALDAVLRLDDQGSISAALVPIAVLVLLSTVTGVSGAVEGQGERLLAAHLQRQTVARVFDVTTRVPLDVFEGPAFYDDLSRVLVSSRERPLALAQGLVQLAGGAVGVVGLSIALVALQPLLLPILLVAALPLWVLARRSGRLEYLFTLSQTSAIRWRDYLTQILTGRAEAKEVRAFDLGPRLRRAWSGSFESYLGDLRAHLRRVVAVNLIGALLTTVVMTAALGGLVALVASDRLSLADAGAAALAVRLLATRIQALFVGVGRILEASLFVEDLDAFLRQGDGGPVLPGGGRTPGPTTFEEVELDRVSFSYPGVDEPVLRGASLRIAAGEVVALVGENGSGKTTLAKLIARLFHPTAGTMSWNGVDAREMTDEAIREQVGVIFQDFVRYNATVSANIAFGAPDRAEDPVAIADAAARAGAAPFVDRLTDGYDTELGKIFDGGQDLSLGQWQRIALARAFYRGAPFLILDEPTASLDAKAEHDLFEHVRRLAEGRAVLLISHRFSTVRFADRIYVLDAGMVVEEGDHHELMALDGRYAEMFNLQAGAYRL